jgi:hypothetical protein
MMTILAQRQMRRESSNQKDFEPVDEQPEGSPDPIFKPSHTTGDPSLHTDPELQQWLTPEGLADVRQMIDAADNSEAIEWIHQTIPLWVMEHFDRLS